MQQYAQPSATAPPKNTLGAQIRAFLTYQPSTRISTQDIVMFCRQLASFVRVGIPVTTAINTLQEQTTNKALKEAYSILVGDLERGVRLSDALGANPKVFPRIIHDMVKSAEATGNLDQVLKQAAKHIEREAAARQKIRSAMTYPVIIASFAVVVTIGMVAFILPKFKDLYVSLGAPLPGLLRFALYVNSFFGDHYILILLGILLFVVGMGYFFRTERGHRVIDEVVLKIPVIAPMLRASMTERFCRTLGDMLTAGVPISQAFGVVLGNVRNRVYHDGLAEVGPAMASGQGIYRPLQSTAIFPASVIQMIRVGEETGHLDSNLGEAAEMYEEELDYRIKRMTAFLEPALIIFVGCIVGFVAVTMITSIYSLAGNFK